MKKHLTLSLMALAVFAFVLSPVTSFAGPNCGAKGQGDAKTTSAQKAACSAKTASADKAACTSKTHSISADGKSCCASKSTTISASLDGKACAGKDSKACAAKFGMSEEECKNLCANYTMIKMNIEGMTCGSCENTVTASLENLKGVKKVAHVSHKDGIAVLFVDSKQIENKSLVNAVTNKGFKAQLAVTKLVNDVDKTASKSACSGHTKAADDSKGSSTL